MLCPECNQEMLLSGKFYMCGNHDVPVIIPVTDTSRSIEIKKTTPSIIDMLPSPIAIVYDEYVTEEQPFVKLHRLTDTAEMVTRFFAIVALSSLHQQLTVFPETIKKVLIQNLSRPTFGAWRNIAQICLDYLHQKKKECFIDELSSFWKETWVPLIGKNDGNPDLEILALRNRIAHAGRLPNEQAQEIIQGISNKFDEALEKLAFLNQYQMVASIDSEGSTYLLKGLPNQQTGTIKKITDPNHFDLKPKHIYLIKDGKKLSLFPLQAYDTVMIWSEEEKLFKEVDLPTSLIYLRYNSSKNILEYTAMGREKSYSQKGADFLTNFLQVFNIPSWKEEIANKRKVEKSWPTWDYTFQDLIEDLTFSIVGRNEQIKDVKTWLNNPDKKCSILWISGKPGIGKSAFAADLVNRLRNRKNTFLIHFFFREGDHRCHLDYFYQIAFLKLVKKFKLSLTFDSAKDYASQFVTALEEVKQLNTKTQVIFILDGLDEVASQISTLESILNQHVSDKIVWILTSRHTKKLSPIKNKAETLWNDGNLPRLTNQDVRTLIQEECHLKKYQLFERDTFIDSEEVKNAFIDRLVLQSEGLPLYIKLVIQDINSGRLSFYDENRLPNGLENYYENLLDRMKVGNYTEILNHLFGILSWAKQPLTKQQLVEILSPYYVDLDIDWKEDLDHVLAIAGVVLKQEETSFGEKGWTFYHHSFREHVKQSKLMSLTVNRGLKLLLDWCSRWQETYNHYALKHYHEHLYDVKKDDLFTLAESEDFIQMQKESFPEEPFVPLGTIKTALQLAIDQKEAVWITKFYLHHAHLLVEIMNETPLDGLRFTAKRALNMAMERDDSALWLLLLMWKVRAIEDEDCYEFFYREFVKSEKFDFSSEHIPLFTYLMVKANLDEETIVSYLEKLKPKMFKLHHYEIFPVLKTLGRDEILKKISDVNIEDDIDILISTGTRNSLQQAYELIDRLEKSKKYESLYQLAMAALTGSEQDFGRKLLNEIPTTFLLGKPTERNIFPLCMKNEMAEAQKILEEMDDFEVNDLFIDTVLMLMTAREDEKVRELCRFMLKQTEDSEVIEIIQHLLQGNDIDAIEGMANYSPVPGIFYELYLLAESYRKAGRHEETKAILHTAYEYAENEYYYDIDHAENLSFICRSHILLQDKERAKELIEEIMYYGIIEPKYLLPIVDAWLEIDDEENAILTINRFLKNITSFKLFNSHKNYLLTEATLAMTADFTDSVQFEQAVREIQAIPSSNYIIKDKLNDLEEIAKQEYALYGSFDRSHAYAAILESLKNREREPIPVVLSLLKITTSVGERHVAEKWLHQVKYDYLQLSDENYSKVNILNRLIHLGFIDDVFELLMQSNIDLTPDDDKSRWRQTAFKRMHLDLERLVACDVERNSMEKIIDRVTALDKKYFAEFYFTEVAEAYIARNQLDAALQVVELVHNPELREKTLRNIGWSFVKERKINEAVEVKERIARKDYKEALEILLLVYRGEFDQAIAMVNSIPEFDDYYDIVKQITLYYMANGKTEEAEQLLKLSLDKLVEKYGGSKFIHDIVNFDDGLRRVLNDTVQYKFNDLALEALTHFGEFPMDFLIEHASADTIDFILSVIRQSINFPMEAYLLTTVLLQSFPSERGKLGKTVYKIITEFSKKNPHLVESAPSY